MGRKAAYLKDVLLWGVLGLPALWANLTHTLADRYIWPEVIAGLTVTGVAVVLARPRPLAAMLVAAALWAGSVAVRGDPTVFFPVLAVMSHLAGVRMDRARPALLGLSAAAVVAAVVVPLVRWLLAAQWDLGAWFFAVTGIALFGLVPWLAGHARHQGLALTRAGWERAGHLERERRMLAEQARLRERAAIAREMHDLLGHDLSGRAAGRRPGGRPRPSREPPTGGGRGPRGGHGRGGAPARRRRRAEGRHPPRRPPRRPSQPPARRRRR